MLRACNSTRNCREAIMCATAMIIPGCNYAANYIVPRYMYTVTTTPCSLRGAVYTRVGRITFTSHEGTCCSFVIPRKRTRNSPPCLRSRLIDYDSHTIAIRTILENFGILLTHLQGRTVLQGVGQEFLPTFLFFFFNEISKYKRKLILLILN